MESQHHPGDDIFEYFIDGDTLINSLKYFKLYKSGVAYYDVPFYYEHIYTGAIRDSYNKFYYIEKDKDNEVLLFDFTVKIGDTIISGLNNQISKIYSIDSLQDGRKVFNCFSSHHWGGKCASGYIIEGIGHNGGLLEEMPCDHPGLQEHKLVCYLENGELVYHNDLGFEDPGCDHNSSIQSVFNIKPVIKIFPVPVENTVTIELLNFPIGIVSIEIYDMQGIKLLSNRMDNQGNLNKFSFDISTLKKGIYLIKINELNSFYSQKIVIE